MWDRQSEHTNSKQQKDAWQRAADQVTPCSFPYPATDSRERGTNNPSVQTDRQMAWQAWRTSVPWLIWKDWLFGKHEELKRAPSQHILTLDLSTGQLLTFLTAWKVSQENKALAFDRSKPNPQTCKYRWQSESRASNMKGLHQ